MVRAYKVAAIDRLTSNWPVNSISANRELRVSLRSMRNRIRILAQNDDFIKKYLSMVANNVAGPKGFTLLLSMSDAGLDPERDLRDEAILKTVKAAFEEWSHKENASISGKLSWVDQQRLFCRTLKRDGEVLVRMVAADNPFGFALKFIDVAWLDELYNLTLPNGGNRILMSVEVDQNDRPVAYWLTMPFSEYLFSARPPGVPFRQRVPAGEFIHAFVVLEDDSQARGIPNPHTAALSLKVLDDYEYAELTGAYVDACNLPYLIPPDGDEEFGGDNQITDGNGKQIPRPIEQQVEPGIQKVLPPGWDVKTFLPGHPNANYGEFAKSVLRRAASGLEVSYASLANDLEGANYSSLKAGQQEERASWRYDQNFEAEHFNRVVIRAWLKMSVLVGRLPLTASDLSRIVATWQPRGWPSIEPLKEIQATILAINNFLDSHIDDAAENGQEWEDILAKLARAQKLIKEAGLEILPVQPKPTVKTESQQESDAAGSADDEPPDDGTNRVLRVLQSHLLPAARSNGSPA